MWVKAKDNSKKIVSVLNFPTFSFVYKIIVVKNWLLNLSLIGTLMYYALYMLKRSYDIHLHYSFMTSINYACVKVKSCTKLPISSV